MIMLPATDYAAMGYSRSEFEHLVETIEPDQQRYITHTIYRLAEVYWLTSTVEENVLKRGIPPTHEGLLSLQMYLLLTCADKLGWVYDPQAETQARFEAFFHKLPVEVQYQLVERLWVWKTNRDTLVSLKFVYPQMNAIEMPSHQQIKQFVDALPFQDRFNALVDFLYLRRNWHLHEVEFPQFHWQPNLSVLQLQRLGYPLLNLGDEHNRILLAADNDHWYVVYYQADDPINELRQTILRGLSQIIKHISKSGDD